MQVRDLARDYSMGSGAVHALRGVSFDVEDGEWVAIVGPSGCGKSTLLNLLGAVDTPDAGSLTIAGERIDRLSDAAATAFRLATHRLRVSAVLPHAGAQRGRERGTADGRGESRARRSPRARAGAARLRRAARTVPIIGRRSSAAANSNASRSRARSRTGPHCCSPMNPPANWMRRPGSR